MKVEGPIYRVLLDEDWDLEDLYGFPHAYSQAYSYIYCLDNPGMGDSHGLIDYTLQTYPWKGGYSYINIYKVFKTCTPIEHRPKISSIHYASPGWLDLVLDYDVAVQVAKAVGVLLSGSYAAAQSYRGIHKALSAIKLDRKERNLRFSELTIKENQQLMQQADDLAKHIGFNSFNDLNTRTKDIEVSLKLMMAHYRRLKDLANYVKDGKVSLPLEIDEK